MSILRLVLRELAGMFVDDGNLAISIIGVVAVTAMSAAVTAPLPVTGGVLFVGCVLALIMNVIGTMRREE
jgi:hypothetical protein